MEVDSTWRGDSAPAESFSRITISSCIEVFQKEPHEKIIGRGLVEDRPSSGVHEMISTSWPVACSLFRALG